MKLRFLFLLAALLAATGLAAAERIPAAPAKYFNDYASVVGADAAHTLNQRLEQFERDTSNQILVVIYPKMESDSSVEDYTVRVAQAWKAGQAGRNNGAILFAFMQEHQLYIQVGYGLEGAIPDATAKRIIEREIVPRFRAGDVNAGLTAGVTALMAAAKGEYKGTGSTRAEIQRGGNNGGSVVFYVIIAVVFVILRIIFRALWGGRPTVLLNPRRRGVVIGTPWWGGGGGSSGGGGFFSGGSGGGGGFSGGGGSFGGGGAGGKW